LDGAPYRCPATTSSSNNWRACAIRLSGFGCVCKTLEKRAGRDDSECETAQGLELDARELTWLRNAGKLADRIGALEAELASAEMIVKGHAGQPVANPLLAEVRQHQALLAQTLARLRLDVVETAAGGAYRAAIGEASSARSRWIAESSP
jgi:hypothetical protein